MKQLRDARGRFLPLTIEQKYDLYEREYEKAETKLEKRGQDMYLDKLTYTQFQARIAAAEGSGMKVNAAWVREYVSVSEYEITPSQARKQQEALFKLENKRFRLSDIRQQKPWVKEAWSKMNEEYHKLRESGLSSKEASDQISYMYWGAKS
jgi:hypothetical protein